MSANNVNISGGELIFNNKNIQLAKITVDSGSNFDMNNKSIINVKPSDDDSSVATKHYVNINFDLLVNAPLTMNNKSFVDSTTCFVNNTDVTKKIFFDLSNLQTNQSNTYKMPELSTNIVGTETEQVLSNKKIVSDNTTVINNSQTKQIRISLDNLSNKANWVYELPNGTTQLVGNNTDDVLSNKKITDDLLLINNNDNKKCIKFNLDNLTNKKTRIFEFPDANTKLVGDDTVHLLTKKKITDDLILVNNADRTKGIKFNLNNISNGKTRIYKFPNINTTLIGDTTPNTLTKKKITDDVLLLNKYDQNKKIKFDLSNQVSGQTRIYRFPNVNTTLVGANTSNQLTNKTLIDNSTFLQNSVDSKKKIRFDLGNITPNQTRKYIFPDNNTRFIGDDTEHLLKNKTLCDKTTYIQNNNDSTKKIKFDLSSITSGKTRVYDMPDSSTKIIGDDTVHLLTNKKITDDLLLVNNTDRTKGIKFNLNNISNEKIRIYDLPDMNTTLIGENTSNTLTKKKITDDVLLLHTYDQTKKIKFDLSNQISGETRIYRFPNVNTTFVGVNTSNLLTNKTFVDDSTILQNSLDSERKIRFDLENITPGQTRKYILPDNNTRFIGDDTENLLKNKTFSDDTTYIQNKNNSTKKIRFDLSSITSGQTRVYDMPNSNTKIIGNDTVDTIINKVINANNNVITNLTNKHVGLGNVENIKNNYNASRPPTAFDDKITGYTKGSLWIDDVNNKGYLCLRNTVGNPTWGKIINEEYTSSNLGNGEGLFYDINNYEFKFKSLVSGENINLSSSDNEIIINSTDTYPFLLCATLIGTRSFNYLSVLFFPWTKLYNFNRGKLDFYVNIVDAGIDIRAYNPDKNSVLGEHTTITTSGLYSFPIAIPSTDTIIEIQIKKNGIGENPEIKGIVLIFSK